MLSARAEPPADRGAGSPPPWGRDAGPDAVVAWAPAKVNLTLEVTGKRPDGYHAIETLMVAVDLFDTIEIRRADAGVLSLTCDPPTVPADGRNLVYRAAAALRERFAPAAGAAIRLVKRIPHEAGLGGGSSDAATTLLALDRLWRLDRPPAELSELAAGLGSDVPFFLAPPAGWCTGRGEVVEPAAVGRPLDLVIVKPAAGCPTADVYRRVAVPHQPADGTPARDALRAGDVDALGGRLFNRLRGPAFAVAPAVEAAYRRLLAAGPAGCQVSGSGSAVFALCRDRRDAVRVAQAVRAAPPPGDAPPRVFVVRSWPQ
jgi:4-diphosphocytidyl-2-C-methyl-D-erythritol kinase